MTPITTWDPEGDARRALRTAVDDGGPGALSNPQLLDNLLRDLLPDLPRESALIVAAAQVDLAAKLTQQIRSHVDPETAVRLAADSLARGRPFEPSACRWVAEEFALALGYDTGRTGPDTAAWVDLPPPPRPRPGFPGGGPVTPPRPGPGARPAPTGLPVVPVVGDRGSDPQHAVSPAPARDPGPAGAGPAPDGARLVVAGDRGAPGTGGTGAGRDDPDGASGAGAPERTVRPAGRDGRAEPRTTRRRRPLVGAIVVVVVLIVAVGGGAAAIVLTPVTDPRRRPAPISGRAGRHRGAGHRPLPGTELDRPWAGGDGHPAALRLPELRGQRALNLTRKAIAARQGIVTELGTLNVDGLANGLTVQADLISSLDQSLTADRAFAAWMEDVEHGTTTCSAFAKDANWTAASADSAAATATKTAFLQVWNPLAQQYGLPVYQQSQL